MNDTVRLVEIAERVLAGEPIEIFSLGEYEIFVVTGYCEQAIFGADEIEEEEDE